MRHGSIWRILAYLGISNALANRECSAAPATNASSEHFVLFLLSPTAVHVSESRIQGRPGTRRSQMSCPIGSNPERGTIWIQLEHDLIWFDWISLSPFMNSRNTILYASLIFSYSLTMITNYDKKCHKLLTNLSSGPSSPVAWEIMRSGCDSATPTLQLYKDQCCITACSWHLAARKWSKGKEGLESACKIS